MKQPQITRRACIQIPGVSLVACAFLALSTLAQAGELVQTEATPGGISPTPLIKSVKKSGSGVEIQWKGYAGPYQLQTKSSVSNTWVTHPEFLGESTTIPAAGGMAICRVMGPTPRYYGAAYCNLCHDKHGETFNSWTNSRHAGALQTLASIGQDKNPYCLKCHTVGMGYSTGYTNNPARFAGVQCENCHGPAQQHVQDVFSFTPVVSPSAVVCGGCHDGFHHPTYTEWQQAAHAEVTPDVAEAPGGILSTNPATSLGRMTSCGPCHSGAVRLGMLEAWEAGDTNIPAYLPPKEEAAEIAITCVVCHEPHGPTAHEHQLRNPLASQVPFSYFTSTNFTRAYNTNVQICAQCHNMRGALYTGTSRPPHHSPQYNMLIGDGGVTNTVPFFNGPHKDIEIQCAQCHVHSTEQASPSPVNPNYVGHQFIPTTTACLDCHSSTVTNALLTATQAQTKQQIGIVQSLLNTWALTKAPAITNGFTAYGKYAWEYTTAGQLSNPTGSTNIVGPPSSLQSKLPVNIQQARFNLYLVEHDASKGIHNPPYLRYLLSVALDKVSTELSKP